jgi:hypothetical protein
MANSKTPSSDLEQLFERVARQQLTLKQIAYTLGVPVSTVQRLFALYSNNPAEFRESEYNQKLSHRLQQLPPPSTNKASDNLPDAQAEPPFKKPLKADDICQAMIELGNTYYDQNKEIPKSSLYLRKFMISARDSGWEVIDKPDGRKSCIKIEGQVITYDAFNKRFKKYLDDNGR